RSPRSRRSPPARAMPSSPAARSGSRGRTYASGSFSSLHLPAQQRAPERLGHERLIGLVAALIPAHVGVLEIARWPVGGARRPAVAMGHPRLRDQRLAFLRQRRAAGEILLAIEVLPALDPGLEAQRIRRERASVPHREVGVLPDFERSHAIVDPELLRRIER